MGNLLFSPSGRIGPDEFMSGVKVLILISLVLGLLPVFVPSLAFLGIIGIVLLWCWIVLWIKRYHDGGKSGWMCLIPIIVFIVASIIFAFIIKAMFTDPGAAAAIEAATQSGDFGALMGASAGGGLTKLGQIVNAVGGAALGYVIAMVINNTIARDGDNQYGPA